MPSLTSGHHELHDECDTESRCLDAQAHTIRSISCGRLSTGHVRAVRLFAVAIELAAGPILAGPAGPEPALAPAPVLALSRLVGDDAADDQCCRACSRCGTPATTTTASTAPAATTARATASATTASAAPALCAGRRRRGDREAQCRHPVHGHHQHDGDRAHPSFVPELHAIVPFASQLAPHPHPAAEPANPPPWMYPKLRQLKR